MAHAHGVREQQQRVLTMVLALDAAFLGIAHATLDLGCHGCAG